MWINIRGAMRWATHRPTFSITLWVGENKWADEACEHLYVIETITRETRWPRIAIFLWKRISIWLNFHLKIYSLYTSFQDLQFFSKNESLPRITFFSSLFFFFLLTNHHSPLYSKKDLQFERDVISLWPIKRNSRCCSIARRWFTVCIPVINR